MVPTSVLAASSPFPFSISGFTGLTTAQIISFLVVFVIFNFYVVLEAAALVAFYVTSKPRHGRVRTAATWHFVATLLMLMAFISLVWGAPAEKTFINSTGVPTPFGSRAFAVLLGFFLFTVPAIICMMIGFAQGAAQKREIREQALSTA